MSALGIPSGGSNTHFERLGALSQGSSSHLESPGAPSGGSSSSFELSGQWFCMLADKMAHPAGSKSKLKALAEAFGGVTEDREPGIRW